jgi:hypothetical protein
MSRGRNVHRNVAAGLGATVLALGLALGAATSSQAATDGTAAGENLPGVPAPGSPADEWETWAAQERADAEATDWKADAAARGCTLEEVTISEEVDTDYNLAMGAPADLRTHRVDLLEKCADSAGASDTAARAATSDAATLSLPSGDRCATTSGPGTMCLTKSSGRIYASWQYRGSGSVTGFLRIYRVSTGVDGCPTGTTWLTGASATWSNGDTRTISKTRTTAGGYSAHMWKKVLVGHTDWGGACSSL